MRIETSQAVIGSDGSLERFERSVITVASAPARPSCELEPIDDFDDLYQCGLAQAQRLGQMEAFTERFNIEACCDAQERAIILALKNYLRPQQAPADLLNRVMSCLDRVCREGS